AMHDAANVWIRTAVLSSVPNSSDELLIRLIANKQFVASGNSTEFIRELAQIVGVRGQTAEMQRVLKVGNDNKEIVFGIGDGLKRSGKNLRDLDWDAETRKTIDQLFSEAARIATDGQAPSHARLDAIHLLTFDTFTR